MADRSNARLNEAIEQHIAQWDGTVHGFCIKNMWENGADYESICEAANIDIEDYREDAMQNVFYGNDGIDIAFQREKISWKEHQMLLAIIEKMA